MELMTRGTYFRNCKLWNEPKKQIRALNPSIFKDLPDWEWPEIYLTLLATLNEVRIVLSNLPSIPSTLSPIVILIWTHTHTLTNYSLVSYCDPYSGIIWGELRKWVTGCRSEKEVTILFSLVEIVEFSHLSFLRSVLVLGTLLLRVLLRLAICPFTWFSNLRFLSFYEPALKSSLLKYSWFLQVIDRVLILSQVTCHPILYF